MLITLAALLALPLQAHAQTDVILVDNLEQSLPYHTLTVGGDNHVFIAQKFTIPEGADYILSDLTIDVSSRGDHPMVMTIRAGSGSSPGSVVHTLRPPASPGTGHETYTALPGAVLEANKSYFVRLAAEQSGGTKSTVIADADTGQTGLDGWGIANAYLRKASAGPWTNLFGAALRIRLRGREVSNNPNLSALTLEQPLTGTAIALDPAFSPFRGNYTASVPNRQSVVKLTATQADSGATVAIENDIDLGTQTPNEARLPLEVGSNTLRVTVTAEDGVRTKIYRVVVTRAASPGVTVSESAVTEQDATGDSYTVTVGGSATGETEYVGDRDWFAVELEAGKSYRFDLEGSRTDAGSLSDPYLYGLYDDDGDLISGTTNDNGGAGLNSRVGFTATEDATYYVSAGTIRSLTGTYLLSVEEVI